MFDPFAIFGLPRKFSIDSAGLDQKYLAMMAEHHPDRFLDPGDQADAAERIAQISQAHRLLSDPATRADALLMLLGGPTGESDKSLPPELLEQMLEIREQLQEASARDDRSTLHRLHHCAASELRTRLQTIERLFSQIEPLPTQEHPAILRQIRLELNALRYYQRLYEQTSP